jgi:uncharacterized protein (DUF433 family)
MSVTVQYRYIDSVPGILSGEPVIKGTRIPVRTIVLTWRRGVPPEEIPEHFPHITVAQVFEALSYYSDNQDEINGYIERNHVPNELVEQSLRDRG